jgi:uncharacterized SAM-binding protein YcdF (DUF218 family)
MEMQDIAKFLINPLLYVLAGLFLILFIKKHRIKLTLMLVIYFYLISITCTGKIFSQSWKINDTYNPVATYDAVVVLAGVSDALWNVKSREFPYIPNDFFAVANSSDKIFAGIYFVKSGHAKILLIGEWIFNTYNEAKAVKKLASDMGLRENQIHIYSRVKRTINEVEGVKFYVEKHPLKNILLVAAETDMRRALAMFKKHGLNPDAFSVNKETGITWQSFVPNGEGILKTEEYLYEITGYIGYYLKNDL